MKVNKRINKERIKAISRVYKRYEPLLRENLRLTEIMLKDDCVDVR